MLIWVVGAGGLLGSAIVERAVAADADVYDASVVPWEDAVAAGATLASDAARFSADAGDEPWAVVWAAGAAVVASSDEDAESELAVLQDLLHALTRTLPAGPGAVLLCSSAGGVYAGSATPPFDVSTVPRPISPYGRLKLAQEALATELLAGRVPLAIARFSNLYGSEHKLTKGQGLIPLLCHASLHREPLNLYVSMDTVRDYLFIDDAAEMAWLILLECLARAEKDARTTVVANGQPATVAEVIGTVQHVAHRRVPLALGTHPSAPHQIVDLRLTPSPELAAVRRTSLPTGVKRVYTTLAGRAG